MKPKPQFEVKIIVLIVGVLTVAGVLYSKYDELSLALGFTHPCYTIPLIQQPPPPCIAGKINAPPWPIPEPVPLQRAVLPTIPDVIVPDPNDRYTYTDSANDTVLLDHMTETSEINIESKVATIQEDTKTIFSQFKDYPKETRGKSTSIYAYPELISQDRTKAIVIARTIDETAVPNGFDGSMPVLKGEEFICDTATKACARSNILNSAHRAVGEKSNWYYYSIYAWNAWDSQKHLLYGHLQGEGIGNASPFFIYNTQTRVLEQTFGYNARNDHEKRAEVPGGALSPSLSKFIMIDEHVTSGTSSSTKWNILLYDTANLASPFKVFDIPELSKLNQMNEGYDRISSVAWSKDEKHIALGTQRRLYMLDLETGVLTLRFVDNNKYDSGSYWDFNTLKLSQSGRYLVFVDYQKRTTPLEANKMETVLVALDLKDNKIIELLRESSISLHLRGYR